MLVSIIIPCYNVSNYIKKCVDSILNQSYKEIEIILVDDCSTDNTKEIIKALAKESKKIKIIFSKKNQGPGGAKNEGLKEATGKYIMFIDSDDYIDTSYVEIMVNAAELNPKYDIYTSGFKKVTDKDEILYKRAYKNNDIAKWQAIATWGKLYRTEWFKKNKIKLASGHVFEDILFQAAQFTCDTKYYLVDCNGYNYLLNNKSISHTTLASFKKGGIEQEQEYLINLKKKTNNDAKTILDYFAFRTMCWHLLKGGCKVGKANIIIEYDKAFNFLNKEFPNFKHSKILFNKDRLIIRIVLVFIKILYKLHLSRAFFSIYGRIDLRKLWPNM